MTVTVKLELSQDVVEQLSKVPTNHKSKAVQDVLLSNINELVPQVVASGLVNGTIITKKVGMTYNSTCERSTEVAIR